MSELLPSESEVATEQPGDVQTLWLDSDEAGDLLSSLASETARSILTGLHEEPATASEIADRAETSLQNARHHLSNLEEAGLVRVADTRYSEKGREMNVYAPSEDPMVVFVGNEEGDGFLDALRELTPAIGLLALGSVVAQYALTISSGPSVSTIPRIADGMGGSGLAPLGVPVGVVFFAGGLLTLLAAAYWRQ